MNRLKKGDQVYIISGKDKGKTGTVNRLTQDDKVLVDGINLVKKMLNPTLIKTKQVELLRKKCRYMFLKLCYLTQIQKTRQSRFYDA